MFLISKFLGTLFIVVVIDHLQFLSCSGGGVSNADVCEGQAGNVSECSRVTVMAVGRGETLGSNGVCGELVITCPV